MSKKIIFSSFAILLLAVLFFFGYLFIKNHYSTLGGENKTQPSVSNQSSQPIAPNEPAPTPTGNSTASPTENPETNPEINPTTETPPAKTVSRQDCDNECASFTKQTDIDYCREVCGLNPVQPKTAETECDSLTGVKKDICLKDLAITQKDQALCAKIQDIGLRQTCVNRILEDWVDQPQQQ
jgi:hypothetical protein